MYDALFSELRLGKHTVRNRILFSGPVTGFTKDGKLTSQLAAYYLERAKGGAGLIELEPGLTFHRRCINEWMEFAELIHTYGTKLVATFKILRDQAGAVEKRMSQGIVESARLLGDAGFDGISLYFEEKPPQYGCEKKETQPIIGRWIKKLLQSISENCEEHFIIGVHVPTHDSKDGQVSPQCLQGLGADYMVLPSDDGFFDFRVPIRVAKSVDFAEPQSCEKLLANGGADMVALSRQLICDPYWVVKAELGKEKEIRKHDCFEKEDDAQPAGHIRCTLNPYLGQESMYSENNMMPAAKFKNVIILGGGPAGMQAAITASQRGHSVFMFEKEDELGGRLKSQDHAEALNWFLGEMKRNQVDVRLGICATVEHIAAMRPDIVIMAVGESALRKPMISLLHEKGIQVVDVNDSKRSIGQAIRSGFQVAIGI